MDIECVVCDMDGTLLNSERDISEGNVRAMRQLKEKGVELVLATGRTDLYVKDVAHRLGVTAPIISANGGMVRRMGSSEVLFHKYLPQDSDRILAEACFAKDYDCIIFSSNLVFYRKNSERVKFFQRYNDRVQPSFRVPLQEISQPDDLPLGKVLKFFLWNITSEQAAELECLYNQSRQLTMVSSEKGGLDIVPQGISKGEGLRFLAQKLGFDLKKTVVFGDNYNDISMMKVAGIPIAVANAEQEVQQIAKFVTRSNDEDGVAHAIQNYILA
ncbi:MAG: HAD family hydrolase [Pelosinus sp.]|nr:HAD family hydrolase [Pelosinus sp.]